MLFTADSGNLLAADLDNVSVDYVGAPSLGDFNGDGIVDMNDYKAWKNAFGSANTAADGNGDGTVDAADFTIWRNSLGRVVFGAGPGATSSVPEPTTLVLTILAMAVGCLLRSRSATETSHQLINARD